MTAKEMELRIKKYPWYCEWESVIGADSFSEKGEIDYSGLSDEDKFCLYVFAWNKADICPSKRRLKKLFSWSDYKVRTLFAALKPKGMACVATFSERTGLISGRGYQLNIKEYENKLSEII